MSTVSGSSDELKTLQREAAELQKSRDRAGSAEVKEPGLSQKSQTTNEPIQGAVDAEATAPSERENHDISEELEMYLKEIEEAALERPVLTLLATFTLGIIVGQLLSRR